MKKVLSLMLAFVMFLGVLAPSISNAEETKVSVESYNLEQELSKELKFYFEEVGNIDENGHYNINNVKLLQDRAKSGDKNAQIILNMYNQKMNRGAVDFGKCILTDYFGVYIDLIQGNLWDSFMGYVKSKAWTQAAKIILKVAGKSASKANLLATVAQLTLAAYNCSGEW